MGQRVVPERNEQNALTQNIIEIDTMLVRDYLAGQALAVVGKTGFTYSALSGEDPKYREAAAKACYDLADAMIAERSKRL